MILNMAFVNTFHVVAVHMIYMTNLMAVMMEVYDDHFIVTGAFVDIGIVIVQQYKQVIHIGMI